MWECPCIPTFRCTTCGAPPKKLVVGSNFFGNHLLGNVVVGDDDTMVGGGVGVPHDRGQDLIGKAHQLKKSSIDDKKYLNCLREHESSRTTIRWCWHCMGARWQRYVCRLYLGIYTSLRQHPRCGEIISKKMNFGKSKKGNLRGKTRGLMIWHGGRYRVPKAAPPSEHACWGRWSILALPDDAIKVMFGRSPLEMMECE
jgi:hypothetical protein